MDLLKKYIVSGTNGAFFGNFIKTFYFGLIYGAGVASEAAPKGDAMGDSSRGGVIGGLSLIIHQSTAHDSYNLQVVGAVDMTIKKGGQ